MNEPLQSPNDEQKEIHLAVIKSTKIDSGSLIERDSCTTDTRAHAITDEGVETVNSKGAEATNNSGAETIIDDKMTVIKITSLCVVAMTANGATSPSSSLITGCCMLTKDGTKVPVLLMHFIKPKTMDYDKLKLSKSEPLSSPDANDEMYDFFFDQDQTLDSLPIPTLPLSNAQSSMSYKDGELSHVCELNLTVPLNDFKLLACTDGMPVINNIVAVPSKNVLAVSLYIDDTNQSDEFNGPVGAVILFSIFTADNGFTDLKVSPYTQLLFNNIGDIIVDMSTVQLIDPLPESIDSNVSLACVTKSGSLKIYSLSMLDLLATYSVEGVSFSHVVSCDLSLGMVVLAARDGSVQSVKIAMETKMGVSDSDDMDIMQLLSG